MFDRSVEQDRLFFAGLMREDQHTSAEEIGCYWLERAEALKEELHQAHNQQHQLSLEHAILKARMQELTQACRNHLRQILSYVPASISGALAATLAATAYSQEKPS